MLSIKLGSGACVLASALAISPLGLADDNHSNSGPYHQQQNIKQFETDAASFGMSLALNETQKKPSFRWVFSLSLSVHQPSEQKLRQLL